ncbi:CST complex subunit CTC1 isoform X2 [Coffea arabica]|uniref:CST complex subunit CTC1 n=1 Tax=Coffea arabica TaxID=13443 RepID=A0A6P6UIW6_COFAR
MEGKTANILKISDLISCARPLTGVSSLTPGGNVPSSAPQPQDEPPMHFNKPTSQNPTIKLLKPLNHPAILIGAVSLPLHSNKNNDDVSTIECSCLQFTDGSVTICCDVLDFQLQMIGQKIRICAWNFIPLRVGCRLSGFLEIIRWEFIEYSSNLTEFSLGLGAFDCKDDSKVKYSLFGVLESISPVSVVPCSTGGSSSRCDSRNICGFLVKILVCECEFCRSRKTILALRDLSDESCKNHCFLKCLIVYFCGSASSWHPVMVRLIGNLISLSGLKKKLVYIGKDDSELMYVTTDKALLRLPVMAKKYISKEKAEVRGFGEVGSYAGTVTGVYMQGMVVELDQGVLLLLTDHQLMVPHSLRVGAIVSVKNVHFVSAKYSWTKILLLGTCFMTCICVESFSPMETGCHRNSHSQNSLRKFVDSMVFPARLWVLLTVTCFRKKFAGILSEKEILGSKHEVGLAQTYTNSHLPASAYQMRHGVFLEYCRHGSCAYHKEEDYSHLKLVVPISCLWSDFENRWIKMLLDSEDEFDIINSRREKYYLSCCGKSYANLIRKTFQIQDTGVILLGNLKVPLSSGRLQLVDATGSIDVVIPDIPSNWDLKRVYEVEDFTIVMQGIPDYLDCSKLLASEPLTCRNIFENAPLVRETKISLFLYYHFGGKTSCHSSFSSKKSKESLQEFEGGNFHLLLLKHKFPLLHKCLGDQFISNKSSAFAEVAILPWDLVLPEKNDVAHLGVVPVDELKNVKYEIYGHLKRCKTDAVSIQAQESGLSEAANLTCGCSNDSYCTDFCTKRKHCDASCPLKFPCLISSRSIKCPYQGLVHCTDKKEVTSSGCNPDGRRVFLEFDSESLNMYQRLRIGAFYMVKHHQNDVLCRAKVDDKALGGVILVSSETCLWRLSFSSDVVAKNSDPSPIVQQSDSCVSNDEITPDTTQQFQVEPLKFNGFSPESYSDFNLCVPADVISYFKIDANNSKTSLMKSPASLEEEIGIYNVHRTAITATVLSPETGHSNLLLPEGNLLTFRGQIVAIHDSSRTSFVEHLWNESPVNVHQPIFSQGTSIICIHALVDYHMAMIFGALDKQAYPTGFGTGVHATFHRILVLGQQNHYMLIPASFIEIDSVNVVDNGCNNENDPVANSIVACYATSPSAFPAALISEVTDGTGIKLMQLHCRENKKASYSSTRLQSGSLMVEIPLAGFILDDGSSCCCCWANHERAANMLGLPTQFISTEACARTSQRLKIPVRRKTNNSSFDHLNRIIRQHKRVVVKNFGSMIDSSCLDLTFSVGGDKVIGSSDENLLRCLVMSACFSSLWTVVGSLMDSTAINRLEKQLSGLEMTLFPLPNIWASSVCRSDPLAQSRMILQALIKN